MSRNRNDTPKQYRGMDVTEEDVRYNVRKGYGNGVYMLEKILDKRITGLGKTLYLIKWMGYSNKDNTWEPPENVDPVSLREFEEELAQKKRLSSPDSDLPPTPTKSRASLKRKRNTSSSDADAGLPENQESLALTPEESLPEVPNGSESESKSPAVDREGFMIFSTETNLEGRELTQILGLTEHNGKIFYLVQLENGKESVLVESKKMREHFPCLTISFLEQHITWTKSPE